MKLLIALAAAIVVATTLSSRGQDFGVSVRGSFEAEVSEE